MKSKLLLILAAIAGVFTSCYEDDSNKSIDIINPIVIDLGGASSNVSAYLLDTLEIKPMIYKIGTGDADLSFEWKISGNDIIPFVMDNTMALKAVVTVQPHSNAYDIVLTVTDNTTGLKNFQEFNLSVFSALGRGLVIADTKDGINSDLNLIMSKEFSQRTGQTFDERDTKVLPETFSQVNNGLLIDGIVHSMSVATDDRYSYRRLLTAVTESSAIRVDPYYYELYDQNESLFFAWDNSVAFRPADLIYDNSSRTEIMVIEGLAYPRSFQRGNEGYQPYLATSDNSDYYLSKGCSFWGGYSYDAPTFYDEKNNRFLRIPTAVDQLGLMTQPSAVGPFDLNNVGDLTPLFMGEAESITESWYQLKKTFAVMKSRTASEYYLLSYFGGSAYNGGAYRADGKYNLTGCPEISSSIDYDCSPTENVLFYATSKKIYAVLLASTDPSSGETPQTFERYTVENANEVITSIDIWKWEYQGQLKFKDVNRPEGYYYNWATNRMMIITTYNESTKEGKVIAVPLMNPGSGTIETDKNFHIEYGGFGRITCVTAQTL